MSESGKPDTRLPGDAAYDHLSNDEAEPDRPSRRGWRLPSEGTVLTGLFRGLLAAVVVFLAVDFNAILESANAPLPGQSERTSPVVMPPPAEQDHVRPYLPRAMPVRRGGKGPTMPGYTKPVTDKAIGEPMTFVRGPDGKASAVGRIEPGMARQFADFIAAQNGEIKELHLHSPGGSVQDALQMSRLIRDKSIAAVVPGNGYCASSCPILLSGGVERSVGRDAWVGVHQVYAAETSRDGSLSRGMAEAQTISATIQDHLSKMGVDSRVWVHAMKTPSAKLYIFTPAELRDYRLSS